MVPVLLVAVLAAASPSGPEGADPGAAAGTHQAAEPVCVVAQVDADTADAVDLDLIRRLFLLRQRFWPGGEMAHPVNLPASSEVRERFSVEVMGQSIKDLAAYWNERYFHGTRPPPTVASEAAVLLFVARTPGGVGYVERPLTAELPEGVRSLLCLPEEGGATKAPSSP